MAQNFPEITTLLKDAKTGKRYRKLISQLQKDLILANITSNISLDITETELASFLTEKIYYLIMERFSEYLNLLYIIDVPERSFKEIKVTDAVEVAGQVSFLILKRELQKVKLKEKYSS